MSQTTYQAKMSHHHIPRSTLIPIDELEDRPREPSSLRLGRIATPWLAVDLTAAEGSPPSSIRFSGVDQWPVLGVHRGKDDLFDRVGRAELAANEFRITQTEQKLVREHVKGERAATDTHREVGTQVRRAIERIGGTMPEDLPVENSIKKIEARRRAKAKAIAHATPDQLAPPH